MLTNFSRHPLNPQSTEYTFVADKFNQSWGNVNNLPPPVISLQPAPLPPPNNIPMSPFQTFVFPHVGPMPPPVNNNNTSGPTPFIPPPPMAHMLRPMMHQYPMPPGMLPPGSLAPPPPPPQPQQQSYRSLAAHRRTRRPPPFPMTNPIGATNPRGTIPQIIQIERVQNQRWYKQYSAHECEFRQKLGKQTEQWLFHGNACVRIVFTFIFLLL